MTIDTAINLFKGGPGPIWGFFIIKVTDLHYPRPAAQERTDGKHVGHSLANKHVRQVASCVFRRSRISNSSSVLFSPRSVSRIRRKYQRFRADLCRHKPEAQLRPNSGGSHASGKNPLWASVLLC